jgi:uncharacterized membrane protein YedE/YeeE
MTIENFTPWTGLAGGALIGLSAAALLLLNGDILGASGIVSSTFLQPVKALTDPAQHWKLVLLSSFMLISAFYLERIYDMEAFAQARPVSMLGYAIGGFFVGFGTKLGNGCTTGHGICGLARFSKRSFVAVLTFMSTAILVSQLTAPDSFMNGITGFLRTDDMSSDRYENAGIVIAIVFTVLALIAPLLQRYNTASSEGETSGSTAAVEPPRDARAKLAPAAAAGLIFAGGLYVSDMVYPTKIFDFLNLSGLWGTNGSYWDPTLIFVMGGGLAVSMVSYQFLEGHAILSNTKKLQHPMTCQTNTCEFGVPNNCKIDWQLVAGAVFFGIGWGVAGLCPGPAIFLAAVGVPSVVVSWWPAFFVGSFLAFQLKKRLSTQQQQGEERHSKPDDTQELPLDPEVQQEEENE